MADPEHVNIVKQGREAIAAWREAHPDTQLALSSADLFNANLEGANLQGADLQNADLICANLFNANLQGADLQGADLQNACLIFATLGGANLRKADLRKADLRDAYLGDAYLIGADLGEANLQDANLQGANLIGADLGEANLQDANLQGANLCAAIFCTARLIGACLDSASLTDACLWETQRAGWSIKGIHCDAIYWDEEGRKPTRYALGEFERFFSDKIKIFLHYTDGISPIEIATLPALIQHIQSQYPGCTLRLHAIEDTTRGANVILAVDNPGDRTTEQIETMKADLENTGRQLIALERQVLQEASMRQQAERTLQMFFNQLLERGMSKYQIGQVGNLTDISGGHVHDVQITYQANDLEKIGLLVKDITAHCSDLDLNKPEFGISRRVLQAHKDRRMVAISAKMSLQPYGGPYERAHLYVLRNRRFLQLVRTPLSATPAPGWPAPAGTKGAVEPQ